MSKRDTLWGLGRETLFEVKSAVTPKDTRSCPRRSRSERVALTVLLGLGLGALLIALNFLLVPLAAQHDSVAALAGQAYADVQLPAFDRNPLLIRAHVFIGAVFVLIAALQFWRRFRNQNLGRHRLLGYAGLGCLVLLPVTGVAATIVYPFAGFAAVPPNVVWLVAILACVCAAWRAARAHDLLSHEAWVTRATGMTVGITLSRVYEPLLVHFAHVDVRTAVAAVFWLGQGEGLIAAEVWLRRPNGPLRRRAARRTAPA